MGQIEYLCKYEILVYQSENFYRLNLQYIFITSLQAKEPPCDNFQTQFYSQQTPIQPQTKPKANSIDSDRKINQATTGQITNKNHTTCKVAATYKNFMKMSLKISKTDYSLPIDLSQPYQASRSISSARQFLLVNSQIVKDKMHRKKQIFQSGIKFSLEKKNTQNKGQQHTTAAVKIEDNDEDYRQKKQIVIKEDNHEDSESEESEDDLNEFKKDKKQFQQVKKQQAQEKQEQKDENSEQLYEQQDRKKEEILAKSSKRISAHIIATYSTRNKKHIPKDEKTKIDLQQVFIRTADRETFYTKIQCDFLQAQYSNIKL